MIAAFALIVLLSASPVFADNLPGSVDWRGKVFLSLLWIEGRCKSSWAIATATVIQAYHAKENGKSNVLSVQELIDCVNETIIDGCHHGTIETALDWLMNKPAGLMNHDEYLLARARVTKGSNICQWS